jgi:hypothetical protein
MRKTDKSDYDWSRFDAMTEAHALGSLRNSKVVREIDLASIRAAEEIEELANAFVSEFLQ